VARRDLGDDSAACRSPGCKPLHRTSPGPLFEKPAHACLIAGLGLNIFSCFWPKAETPTADLSGITLSKLGLSDDISSPDHEGTQWRGHYAIAISSSSVDAPTPGLRVTHQPFGATAARAALMADPCRRPPQR
jgi:hypothetical protein